MAINLAVALCYWLAGVLTEAFFSALHLFPSPVWLPAAIALAALLRWNHNALPGVALGALLINGLSFGTPWPLALLIALTNSLGPYLGSRLLLAGHAPPPAPFYTLEDALRFLWAGVGVSSLITSIGGTLAYGFLAPQGDNAPSAIALNWFLSDAAGSLLLAPLLILWSRPAPLAPRLADRFELWLNALSVTVMALLLFLLIPARGNELIGLSYLLSIPLIWASVRHPPRQVFLILFIANLIALTGTLIERGVLHQEQIDTTLDTLALFIAGQTLTVLLVSAMISERRLDEIHRLLNTEQRFEAFMDHLPAAAFIKDTASRYLYVNRQYHDQIDPHHEGRSVRDIYPEAIAQALLDADRTALEQGANENDEWLPCSDGQLHAFHTRKFLIPSTEGTPLIGGIALEITERLQLEKRLRASEENYRTLLDTSPNPLVITQQADSTVLYVNDRTVERIGLPRTVLLGRPAAVFYADRSDRERLITLLQSRSHISNFETRLLDGRNEPFWASLSASLAIFDGIPAMVVAFSDISERKALETRLERLAHHDPLTGLPNRAFFFTRLTEALSRARREKRGFALLYIDLNDFKPVNDRYGHAIGDALLRAVAGRMQSERLEGEFLARIGGDEFVYLIEHLPERRWAEERMDTLRLRLMQPFMIEGRRIVIGASIGLACYPDDASDEAGLLRHADSKMYGQKHGQKEKQDTSNS